MAPRPVDEPWPIFACPTQPPLDGARCEAGLECTYGGDVRLHCRPRHVCREGAFVTVAPSCTPIPGPLPKCRFTLARDRAVGPTCTRVDALCDDRGTTCACGGCRSDNCLIGNHAPKNWICANPSSSSCPREMPDLGAECDETTPSCVWGAVSWEASFFGPPRVLSCSDGRWVERRIEPGP